MNLSWSPGPGSLRKRLADLAFIEQIELRIGTDRGCPARFISGVNIFIDHGYLAQVESGQRVGLL